MYRKPSHSTTQTTLGFVHASSSEVPSSSPSTPTETQDNEEQFGLPFRQTLPAPACRTGGEPRQSVTIITPDWSRSTRNRFALLKCASDPNQMKITLFLGTVEKLKEVTRTEPKISDIVEAAQEQMSNRDFKSVSPLFNHLLRNAEHNSQKCLKIDGMKR